MQAIPASIGNREIFGLSKTAFLCSRHITSSAVLRCMDWASKQRDASVCVVSGFHSPLEKEVFYFLSKGSQAIMLILGRSLYKNPPEILLQMLGENRLLIVSPVSQSITRQSEQSILVRNKYIIRSADEVVFGALDKAGSLYPLYEDAVEEGKIIKILGQQ